MSVPSIEDLAQAEPEVARKVFRKGNYFKESTSGMCPGRVQANFLALDKSLAEDFAKFCAANSGPLPVLFQSEAGQFTAPDLSSTDSDVRTDLTAYNIIENGEVTHIVKNILGFKKILQDYVFFYEGCSFTFDQALLAAGVPLRNVQHNTRVSLFRTSVKCHPVGPFKCQMDVSLRPIPPDLVETAFKVTFPLTDYHGAPVHIGNPALIGIPDVNKPDNLDLMVFEEGDIPVFWACGVTAMEAVKAAKPSMAFSHFPGSMYIADAHTQSQDESPHDIKVVTLCKKPYWASVTTKAVVAKIKQLEGFIAEDLDKRGIGNLVLPDDLLKSVLALSHASSVALTTGFPCFVNNKNPYEDGGLPGAIAIAMMLQALGKKVDLMVNKALYGPLTTVLEALVEQKVLARPISVVQFPPEGEPDTLETAKAFLLKAGTTAPRYDHLLAIERAGKAEDGAYYSTKAVDVGYHVGGIDWLFLAAAEMPTVHTTGIRDGGNEVGTGKVRDFLLTCTGGVSSWGGYGVAVGLYLVSTCPVHERYRRRAVGFPPSDEDRQRFRKALPDVDRERRMLHILISHESVFGMTGTDVLHVDDLSFEDVHVKKIRDLLSVM